MTIFLSDEEPLSKYYSVTLHLSPTTRILNENPGSSSARENRVRGPLADHSHALCEQASLGRSGGGAKKEEQKIPPFSPSRQSAPESLLTD